MASCSAFQPAPADGEDCDDCVQVVKTTKTVRVPCHRNEYKQFTVKVPRQVTEEVPRQVNWTDFETRSKQVPYKTFRQEERVKFESQKYQVPVQKTITKMVNVTKKVPKTIYVDVTTQVPKQETITNMEDRTRQVKIPYTVTVPETKFRTEQYQVPIQKSKTVMDKRTKIVYDTQVRTRCEPKVTWVKKEIPVYNVVARPAQPCPPEPAYDGGQAISGAMAGAAMASAAISGAAMAGAAMAGAGAVDAGLMAEFNSLDINKDGRLDAAEYAQARAPAMAMQGMAQQMVAGSARQSASMMDHSGQQMEPRAPMPRPDGCQ